MAWMCTDGRLPDSGGVYDQDARLMYLMRVLENIYHALDKLRNSQGTQIHGLTINERKIIKMLSEAELL